MDPTGQSQDVDEEFENGFQENLRRAEEPTLGDLFREDPQDIVDEVSEESVHAPKVGEKRPRSNFLYCEEEAEPVPDLHAYFSEYELPNADVIRMCRSYANYLASQRRQRGPAKRLF